MGLNPLNYQAQNGTIFGPPSEAHLRRPMAIKYYKSKCQINIFSSKFGQKMRRPLGQGVLDPLHSNGEWYWYCLVMFSCTARVTGPSDPPGHSDGLGAGRKVAKLPKTNPKTKPRMGQFWTTF